MSRWCAKESTDVPLALTRSHHLATSSRERLRRGPSLCQAHRHPSLLPHTAPTDIHHSCPTLLPVTPSSPAGAASISRFTCSEHFNGLFAPFPGPKSSRHPDLLLLGPRAAAGAAPSP